jgi:simple sugar transport system substrate-binding protein
MLDMQTGEFTQSKGQEVMESFLKSYPDIDVVVAENDNMAFGAIDAIKAAGKDPGTDIIIISYDAVKAAFESMIAGDMNVSVECNPLHGPRVAEIIQKLEKGEKVEKIQYVDEGVFPAETAKDIIGSRAY